LYYAFSLVLYAKLTRQDIREVHKLASQVVENRKTAYNKYLTRMVDAAGPRIKKALLAAINAKNMNTAADKACATVMGLGKKVGGDSLRMSPEVCESVI